MPPKQKSKKKKKSEKKRLAELKRKEEEERLRREEEERLRLEEEERKRREEEERKRREEEERLAKEERKRIGIEADQFASTESEMEFQYKRKIKRLIEEEEWERYIQCSHLPNVEDERDLNSFLSVWRDNPNFKHENRNIKNDFEDVQKGIEVMRAIEDRYLQIEDENKKNFYKKYLLDVADACRETLDEITAHIMQFSDRFISQDLNQYSNIMQDFKYSLWVNILKNPRMKYVDFEEINTSVELALKGMSLSNTAIRVIQLKFDPLSIRARRNPIYQPLGEIVYIETLMIPRPPITIPGGWVCRKITELAYTVKRTPYVQQDAQGNDVEPPATQVKFKVPDNALIRGTEPLVAWWNEKKKTWSIEGISDITYDPKTRIVDFKTKHLTTALAVVQSRVMDVPFQYWYITPLPECGNEYAVLVIKPAPQTVQERLISTIYILIHQTKCKLISPMVPELYYLKDKWLPPKILLKHMANSGINLMLVDADGDFTAVRPKEYDLEKKAYHDMAMVCSICAFSSSKWNQDPNCGQNRAVFNISNDLFDPREWVDAKGIAEEECLKPPPIDFKDKTLWSNMSYYSTKCGYMDCSDESEELNFKQPESLQTHHNLYLALQEKYDPDEIKRRQEASDILLINTVRTLLMAIRPLSWC